MSNAALQRNMHPQEIDPNKTQRQASDPESSAWVSASAGSGKTKVLADRVTRLLLSGVLPQKILCLTFTKAAAAEMSIRITERLSRWATCSDDELLKDIDDLQDHAPAKGQLTAARRLFARVLACPGGMRIRTIHAFCQELLRRFPIEAGVHPHFAVIEEGDARALQDDARMELLRMATGAPESAAGKALRLLASHLGEQSFADALSGILNDRTRLTSAIANAGNLQNLILSMRSLFELAPQDTADHLRFRASSDNGVPHEELKRAAEALLNGEKTCRALGQKIFNWLALPQEERAAVFTDYSDAFFTDKGEFFAKYADNKTKKTLPESDEILRREAARLQTVRERLEVILMAETTAALLTLGEELITRYAARKTSQAALDYDDLIIRADELLCRPGIAPWVLYKLDNGLDHILVDEAQDTSPSQWNIVAALADEFFAGISAKPEINRTLFVVGDEKQSIFSFRHADPAAFNEMRGYFSRRITDAEKSYREVPLHTSFRSAPAILNAVDFVFASERARAGVSSGIVTHYPHFRERCGRVEVWKLLPQPEKDKTKNETWQLPLGYEQERDPQAELAEIIAARIKQWITGKEKLSGRPIQPGDIMILLRRRGDFAGLMVRALKKHGVPVTGVDRMRLATQLPVMDLLALMQFAILPEDNLNLATILRGPLIGLSEDQLMEVAIGRESSLWQSLYAKEKFAAARDYLSRWLNAADFMTPFAMLTHILNEPCPASATSGRHAIWSRLGPDALDPMEELLTAAQEFSRRHTPSLQAFLHWLTVAEAEIKREMEQNGGQVRIMTVHAAKGLEAPIVFLPDSAGVPRAQELPKWLWNGGDMPVYVSRKPSSGAARRLWDNARQKQLEEYRRLLYVALTRAASRLYICGWENTRDEGGHEEPWYALVRAALKDKHQPAMATPDDPMAEIVFADPELPSDEVEKKTKPESTVKIELPDWARQPAPQEYVPPRPLAPSRMAAPEQEVATPNDRFARGLIIHRLLQSLPDMEDNKRDNAAARFLANPQHRLTATQQDEIKSEVLALLRHPDYAPLFDADSRAEVPLTGRIGNRMVSGQVDRLCVREDSVWIIDYKTNRPPPAHAAGVSTAYRGQLAAYRAVLTEIYPEKTIHCFLLWTYGPKLMPIPDNLLMDA